MFAKLFTLAALATAVIAAPGDIPATGGVNNSCNVVKQQCCNNVQSANHQSVKNIATGNPLIAAALALASTTVPVGVDCTSITALGLAGNSCNAQPVCCENNNFNGVVAIGCTPININA